MCELKYFIRILLFIPSLLLAEITIYVEHPWIDGTHDNTLNISGIGETGWDTGSPLTDVGNQWFKYVFKTTAKSSTGNLTLVSWGANTWTDKVTFQIGSLSSIFSGGVAIDEVAYIFTTGTNIDSIVFPPKKIVNFLNPWEDNSPKVILGSNSPKQMNLLNGIDGWYSSVLPYDSVSMNITFTDYYETETYTSEGMKAGAPIDLSNFFSTKDTVWINPRPFPNGKPVINDSFPNITGKSNIREISAIVRDWAADGDEFEMPDKNDPVISGMVQDELTSDGKIQKGSVDFHSTNLESWFETHNFGGDVTNDTCIYLEFKKNNAGGWEFNSDDLGNGGFFPIDDFQNPNNQIATGLYKDASGKNHNFHFTMELHTQFVYHEGKNQVFNFTGDDDVWVFVNRKLAIDLGGAHPPLSGSVNLDTEKATLGLTDGETYSLDMFYCERRTDGSNFKVQTSIDIHNELTLFKDSTIHADGHITWEIFEFNPDSNSQETECGFNIYDSLDADTVAAIVDFLIDGPSFDTGSVTLTNGTHFGGITITGDSVISIDSASIVDLEPGEYTITFISQNDSKLSGYIIFTVGGYLPADLEANPSNGIGNVYIFSAESLKVGLETNDTTGAIIYYTFGNTKPTTSSNVWDPLNPPDSILITKDDTLQAMAFSDFNDTTYGIWYYDQQLPSAKLMATPSNDSVYTYTTQFLDVTLETNTGNQIVYQILSSTDTSAWDTTLDSSKVIQISGDKTIKAFTIGSGYMSTSGEWVYECNLPELIIVADPSDTTFSLNLNVLLSAMNADTTVDAQIKYIIDSTNTGYQASQVKANGEVYDPNVGVTITNSVTIYVSAVDTNGDYSDGFGSFTYTIELLGIDIIASPSDTPYYGIGEVLDSIKLSSNPSDGITLTWMVGTSSITDSATIASNGTVWDNVTYPSITTNSASEYYYLSVMATGQGYETVIEVFTYKRQQLPDIIATPSDPDGYKFSGTQDVKLEVIDSLGIFENVQIHYIFDTTYLGASATENDTAYVNPVTVNLDTTIYIKAIATADNAVKSNPVYFYYILATGASSAWYKDESAGGMLDTVDGHIDGVVLDLTKSVAFLPDSIEFISPFDATEKIVAKKANMKFDTSSNNRIFVTLPKPFNYSGSTKIDPSITPNLGKLFGKHYVETSFDIGDSVAPLVKIAYYCPTDPVKSGDSLIINPDTLKVHFTEEVSSADLLNLNISPFEFYSVSRDVEYDMTLDGFADGNQNDSIYHYLIEVGSHTVPIKDLDSIRIDLSMDISDDFGNVQNVDRNRNGVVRALEPKVFYLIEATSPVKIENQKVPEVYKQDNNLTGIDNGLIFAVNFYMLVDNEEMTDVSATIFDQVGNKVASIDGYGKSGNLAVDIVNQETPKSRTLIVFVWDGTNENGRMVSSGTYLIELSFVGPYGNKFNETIAVGIKAE